MREDDTCSVPLLQEITPTQGICMIIDKQYFQGSIYYRNICTLQITDQSTEQNKLEPTSLLTFSSAIAVTLLCSLPLLLQQLCCYMYFPKSHTYCIINHLNNETSASQHCSYYLCDVFSGTCDRPKHHPGSFLRYLQCDSVTFQATGKFEKYFLVISLRACLADIPHSYWMIHSCLPPRSSSAENTVVFLQQRERTETNFSWKM